MEHFGDILEISYGHIGNYGGKYLENIEDIVGVQMIDAKKGGYGRSNSKYLVRKRV